MTPGELSPSFPSYRARTGSGERDALVGGLPGVHPRAEPRDFRPPAREPSLEEFAIKPDLSAWKDRLPFVPSMAGFARASAPLILVGVSLLLGLYRVSDSGPLYADAPRYANGGAMIHDWLRSGELLDPYRFALKNYAQYPAFSIPYHPPLYPGLLGLVFLATGVSKIAARSFLAICLGGVACCFFSILRRLGARWPAALACALLLITTPEVVRWSRSTMSEIPALLFILAGSNLFLAWLSSSRPSLCWAAFGLAGVAFQCRVTSAGVIPCWFLFAALSGQMRRLLSPHVIAASALYLAVNGSYVAFASRYSQLEMKHEGLPNFPLWFTHTSLLDCLRPMQAWGTTPLAIAGLVCVLRLGRGSPKGLFWLCWLVAYLTFMGVVHTHAELRYFFDTLPALAGLAAGLFCEQRPAWVSRRLAPVLLCLGLVLNVAQVVQLPRGVVGFKPVAQRLARMTRPGNVLVACPEVQTFIFRYRGRDPRSRRIIVRGDRSMAIRTSNYTGVPPTFLVHGPEDFLNLIRRGRIRYVVTAAAGDPMREDRTEEMILADKVARSSPDLFALVAEFPVLIQYERPGRVCRIALWEFSGVLPEGPSELTVPIPTSGLELRPGG